MTECVTYVQGSDNKEWNGVGGALTLDKGLECRNRTALLKKICAMVK